MRTDFDFTPYRLSTVGFDHLFDLLEKRQRGETSGGFPAFDIVRAMQKTASASRLRSRGQGRRDRDRRAAEQAQCHGQACRGGRKARRSPSRHRAPRVRTALPARRLYRGRQRELRRRAAKIELSRVVPEAMKPRKIEIGGSAGSRQRIEAPKNKALENA